MVIALSEGTEKTSPAATKYLSHRAIIPHEKQVRIAPASSS
jgi:hypothetical protein